MSQLESGGTMNEIQSEKRCGRCCGCGRSGAAIFAALVWLIQPAFLCLAVPKFIQRFQDLGVALPTLTRTVVDASRWLTGSVPGHSVTGIVFALPVFVSIGVTAAALAATRNATARRASCLFTATGAILLGMQVAAVLVPALRL